MKTTRKKTTRKKTTWKLILVLVILAAATSAFTMALDGEDAVLIESRARAVRDATLAGEYGAVLEYTHPKIIEMMGGLETARQMMVVVKTQMAQQQIVFESYEIHDPGALQTSADQMLVFVPTTAVLSVQGQRMKRRGWLLASRPKSGGAWKFIDGSGVKDPSALETIFPGFPADAVIPEKTDELLEK